MNTRKDFDARKAAEDRVVEREKLTSILDEAAREFFAEADYPIDVSARDLAKAKERISAIRELLAQFCEPTDADPKLAPETGNRVVF